MARRALRHARKSHGTRYALLVGGLVAAFALLVPTSLALPGSVRADNPALVSLESVSNGCGGGVASKTPRFPDSWSYYGYRVNFREACNVHDAAYSGAVVFDPFSGKVIDFRSWTQKEIDDKFFADLRTLCRRQVMSQPAGNPDRRRVARDACEGRGDPASLSLGAEDAYTVVRRFGSLFYRERVDLTGSWINRGSERSLRSATIVQKGRSVRIAWQGADGLCGSGEGTLISRDQDEEVVGTLRITGFANGKTFEGSLRLAVAGSGSRTTVTLPSIPGSPAMHRGAVRRSTQGRAATCARASTPAKPKPPAAQAGAYTLVPSLTELKNAITTAEVTVSAGKVVWDHTGPFGGAGKGGEWKVEYTFAPPQTLTPGKSSSMTVGMQVTSVLPEQPIAFSMSVRAYDFKEQFDLRYPNPKSGSKTYKIPVLASHKSFKELFVIVNCGAAEIVYHYRPRR